jgi:hypothetical protein
MGLGFGFVVFTSTAHKPERRRGGVRGEVRV